ncbi:unnamed protein product [Rotaria socialis]
MSFDAARAIFNQIDVNKDGSIDTGEFNQWMSSAGGSGGAGAGAGFGGGSGSSYESSSFSSGGYGAGAGSAGGAYESSASYGSGGASGFESSASYGSGGFVYIDRISIQRHVLTCISGLMIHSYITIRTPDRHNYIQFNDSLPFYKNHTFFVD